MRCSHLLPFVLGVAVSSTFLVGCQGAATRVEPNIAPAVKEAPGDAAPTDVKSYSTQVMGSLFRIQLVEDGGNGFAAADAAFERARELEGILNLWSKDSELSRWNRLSREREAESLEINKLLYIALEEALYCAERTNGAFDPTIGRALRELGFYGDEPIADLSDVSRDRWRRYVGFDRIYLRNTFRCLWERTPESPREYHWFVDRAPGVEFDLSAMAKGWAASKMSWPLRDYGVATALISAGSSTMAAYGDGPSGKGWPVEVPHPEGARTWWLRDEAISISGQSSLTLPGANEGRSHIFDPRTLAPVDHRTEMVVVRGSHPLDCDMLSTALLVMGIEEGTAWLKDNPVWVDRLTEVIFYSVAEDGSGPEIRTLTR